MNQYKKRFLKWGINNKNIKENEYRAMIRATSRREQENPPKRTQFELHGKPVDPSKITRFTSRPGWMIAPAKDPEESSRDRKYYTSTNFLRYAPFVA